MDWNDETNKVTVGVGILIAVVLIYAIYRVATRSTRESGMYRTESRAKRINGARTLGMVILAVLVFGALIWLLTTFGI